jgi:molybdopterin-containing oxidoreductase family iron-sulfur binding subunit
MCLQHHVGTFKVRWFSTAAATLAACEGPVVKSIPYVLQPEQLYQEQITMLLCFDGFDFANLLVKTREGRPIKIDNNTMELDFPLMLEFMHRYCRYMTTCVWNNQNWGKDSTWTSVDAKIKSSIADAKVKGGQVVLLTNTLASPSTEKLIAEFIGGNPNSKHIVYDAVSSSET